MPNRADIRDVDVIAPNFKRRLSGVTSTIVQLVPAQNRLGQKVATLGPGLPEMLPALRWRDLIALRRAPDGRKARVWHARRNIEMLAGLVLRTLFGMKLKLLFTSAAQRRHTGYTRWLISRMDAVIATSERSGSFLDVPHRVVMHGIDTEMFHPPRLADDRAEAAGLPGRYLAGCFGRVRHQKGTDLFVRAMIELLPAYPEWTAVVSGRVTEQHVAFAEKLKEEIAAAGLTQRIVFLGEVPDIKPWYRRLTLYVAPSRNEGFGLTPLEAMASETAVVASTAGAYAEMIAPGTTGTVVPVDDYEALRDAIRPMLADPAATQQMGRIARGHVQTRFELANEANALGEIYRQLLT